MKRESSITLVGAGPGDPDLITIKGVKALSTADVVLYDALANPSLLDYAPPHAIKVFVGKRAGRHHKRQDEINKMLVAYAHTYGHVVRLKGGDPFVFGRGHEELEYAALHGLKGEYVPGISSATSIPGICGVPLTKRGVSESFTVVTGTLRDGTIAKDLKLAAQSSTTLVVLMGLQQLSEIVALVEAARGPDEPIMLVQSGSTKGQRTLTGNLASIISLQKEARIASPALIIIGQVVNEGKKFNELLTYTREIAFSQEEFIL